MVWSTASPALTRSITRRGFFNPATSSARLCEPLTVERPRAALWRNSSTTVRVRLNTFTEYP